MVLFFGRRTLIFGRRVCIRVVMVPVVLRTAEFDWWPTASAAFGVGLVGAVKRVWKLLTPVIEVFCYLQTVRSGLLIVASGRLLVKRPRSTICRVMDALRHLLMSIIVHCLCKLLWIRVILSSVIVNCTRLVKSIIVLWPWLVCILLIILEIKSCPFVVVSVL